jgi:DNA-binding PadR family transcriptional regulator
MSYYIYASQHLRREHRRMPSSRNADDASRRLPLSPRDFHILLALAQGEGHGYGLVKTIAEQSGGLVELDPANLYRALQRLEAAGLIADAGRRSVPGVGAERRYFRITERGRSLAAAEAERMRKLAIAARTAKLIPGSR